MRAPLSYRNKILTPEELQRQVAQWRVLGKTIAFTNGCFDILHAGHIASLSAAAAEADYLVVGLNSDASVKRLKGEGRPVNDTDSRATVLASLLMVDAVVVFDTDTPRALIASFLPDVLVKGGDYKVADIAGAAEVQAAGGRVVINPIKQGFSTTGIIEKLRP
ncbi:D-glycero-beta-D-manno-heptose 1-phosphate adenylyltransferase [Flaviaesturariibacter aridisoli]|nr:D-glycero-beta-D-manno-heptose 1-phosphate adenylyltransferase [Flaviaesturariibacter aridisoli]